LVSGPARRWVNLVRTSKTHQDTYPQARTVVDKGRYLVVDLLLDESLTTWKLPSVSLIFWFKTKGSGESSARTFCFVLYLGI
jgi:hypothetical protein